MNKNRRIRITTILGVRRNGHLAIGGDGQVPMGESIVKTEAREGYHEFTA